MSKDSIKKGTLVKAWDDDPSEFVVGIYDQYTSNYHYVTTNCAYSDRAYMTENAIPIPDSLAKQLERLGSNKCTNKFGEFKCGDVDQGIGVMLCDECGR